MAFQINEEDIVAVLDSHNALEGVDIAHVMSIIDDDAIVSEVLNSDIDIEDNEKTLAIQVEIAYDVIAKQLFDGGYITREQVEKYGNIKILGQ